MNDRPHVVESQTPFTGRVFTVKLDRLQYDDGASYRVDVVAHGPSFAILPVLKNGDVVLVRQYRHAAGRELWELPAGRSEPGEDPMEGAARELREETGYRAGRMRPIASLYSTPGFCDEVMHIFFADELSAGAQSLDEDERIEVRAFTLEAARQLVSDGVAADLKTAYALSWLESNRGELQSTFGR
jgi:ADP-ribose pyrophosphatase